MSEDSFPSVRWGSESSRLRKPFIAASATRPGSWLIRSAVPLDRKLLLRTHGRFTMLGPFGLPLLLITTTGSKSGLPRTTPLIYVRNGSTLEVVGSNFGQGKHPAWSNNLLADNHATVTIGGVSVEATAELLEGEQRDAAWARFVALAKTYAAYESRTIRHLRVFSLERIPDQTTISP